MCPLIMSGISFSDKMSDAVTSKDLLKGTCCATNTLLKAWFLASSYFGLSRNDVTLVLLNKPDKNVSCIMTASKWGRLVFVSSTTNYTYTWSASHGINYKWDKQHCWTGQISTIYCSIHLITSFECRKRENERVGT